MNGQRIDIIIMIEFRIMLHVAPYTSCAQREAGISQYIQTRLQAFVQHLSDVYCVVCVLLWSAETSQTNTPAKVSHTNTGGTSKRERVNERDKRRGWDGGGGGGGGEAEEGKEIKHTLVNP